MNTAPGTLVCRDPQSPVTLRRHLDALKRKKARMVMLLGAGLGVAAAVSYLTTPVYQSLTRLEIQPVASSPQASQMLENVVDPARRLQTQVELIKSQPVLLKAAEGLKESDVAALREGLDVRLLRDTQIAEVTATDGSAVKAKLRADAVAQAYIAYRRDRAIEQTVALKADLNARLESLRKDLSALDKKIADGRVEVEAQRSQLLVRMGVLESENLTIPEAESLKNAGGAIIEEGAVSGKPIRPNWPVNLGLGAAVGLLAGVGLVLLGDKLDNRLNSIEDIESAAGANVLASIPALRNRSIIRRSLVVVSDPKSRAAESYRTLRTNLRFASPGRTLRTLLVTSPLPGEGKSTVAANLAAAAAESRTATALVSADLRRHATLSRLFKASGARGLVDVLRDGALAHQAVHATEIANLRFVPSGGTPSNPTDLVGSEQFSSMIDYLADESEMVILDAPPVLGLADASLMAGRVDGVLLVANIEISGRGALITAATQIRRAGGRIVGVVANAMDSDGAYAYYSLVPDSLENDRPVTVQLETQPALRATETRSGEAG
ncbi:MAG: polysaccharide biosynthesis tyrosine autokinase [Actinomycetota bacterium]